MIKEVADRDVIERYVTAMRRVVDTGAVDAEAARAVAAIRPDTDATPRDELLKHMPADDAGPTTRATPEGPFLARDPIVSLLQTSIDERMRAEGLVEPERPEGHGFLTRLVDKARHLLHPQHFGP